MNSSSVLILAYPESIVAHAQEWYSPLLHWVGGTRAGAWFELYDLPDDYLFRFRRISPEGRVDCDAVYKITSEGFNIDKPYQFLHDSNCKYFNVEQNEKSFRFEWCKNYDRKG